MATNPKLPDYPDIPPHKSSDQHGKVQMIRQSKFPWPILALIVGAALLIAIIAVLPKGPKTTMAPSGAEIPPQPTASQIQLTNLKTVAAPTGGALYVNGVLHNAGNSSITGVQISAQFVGKDGTLKTVTAPVQGMPGTNATDLSQDPIRPNESRPISIYVDRPPTGWNHQVPELTVQTVTGTTPK